MGRGKRSETVRRLRTPLVGRMWGSRHPCRLRARPRHARVALDHTRILPEFVDRVFEPFFRVTRSGDGHGLGLAIAAQAVQAMGGDIDAS